MNTLPAPPAFGFARRVGALFALVACVLVLLSAYVRREVDSMHRSLERLAEEQRETDSAMYLLHHVRMLDLHYRKLRSEAWKEDSSQVEELRFHCGQALQTLATLAHGPDGNDPSEPGHAHDEARLYDELDRGLQALRLHLNGPPQAASVAADVNELMRLSEVLNDEVHAEEARASTHLSADADAVRSAVFWTALLALAALSAALWLVQRSVVRPVLALRAAARRIAAGDLSHRVPLQRRDEVGELAADFNRMAGELADMHADLERRVDERTREFLRAARLAGLGTMAAGVAHEINNPLASIASCAEGLSRRLATGQADAAEQREYLEIIAKEAYRAHEITSRLLEFARSEPGPVVAFGAQELTRELDVLLRHRLRERSLELEFEFEAELGVLTGRPGEIKQVLLNLLHNAIDASPPNGRIVLRCRRDDEQLVFEVEDSGPGLPPQIAERAFDPFFTTKPPGKGTGLGLSIVERIVSSQRGRVEALDTGHGALFRVSIPAPAEVAA